MDILLSPVPDWTKSIRKVLSKLTPPYFEILPMEIKTEGIISSFNQGADKIKLTLYHIQTSYDHMQGLCGNIQIF